MSGIITMACTGTNFVRCHVCPAMFQPPPSENEYDVEGSCPCCKKQYAFSWGKGKSKSEPEVRRTGKFGLGNAG
jgi:hypothetical protein